MKHVPFVALVFAAALTAIALVVVPFCIGPFFETPPSWKAQREQTRKEARESVERLGKMYGDKPVESWPEERHRQIWRNAERILADLEGR